ncbi:putative spermidine/putrescine transport system permease protein [Rhizobiales bacterium GAS191]|nr:putative spermidine/putrescine transport system permease protein [Rhizobiales bacterium GAS113]SEE67261.1 putative spermidine/putrescine transport system permease protein [Rhizobiales bacterium GAS191]
MRSRVPGLALCAPALAFLAVFFVGPAAGFLSRSFVTQSGAPALGEFERLFASTTYLTLVWGSIKIAAATTLLSVFCGFPVAYLISTADRRARANWMLLVLLPFWSSLLVRTFAWIVILGRQGPINSALMATGLADGPRNLLFSYGAVVTAMTNVLVPFAILTMLGVMDSVNPMLVRAAGTLGARPVQAFFRIYLPLAMPGVTAAILLVFVTALGFFMAPALLGSPAETMIAQAVIQQVQEVSNWPFAATLCVLLLAVALLVFYAFDRFVGLSSLAGETRDRAGGAHGRLGKLTTALLFRAGDMVSAIVEKLRRRDIANRAGRGTRTLAVVVIVFLFLPLLLLVPVSLSAQPFISWPPGGLTLHWYAEILTSPLWLAAAARSFLVAFLTALLCLAVAVPAALALARMTATGARTLFALLVSPLIVPRIVIAVGLFYVYARLGLVGTIAGLVIGHAVIALPFVVIAIVAVLKTYDRGLDLAAASLGASPFATARRVTLPLIATGLVSSALFAFVVSFDELNIALFASGGVTATLPKLMWDEATLSFSPLLAAVSTLVLIAMSAVVLIANRLRPSTSEA